MIRSERGTRGKHNAHNDLDEADLIKFSEQEKKCICVVIYLVGNVQCIVVRRQTDVCLLLTIGPAQSHLAIIFKYQNRGSPNECVDFRSLDVIKLLHRVLDLTLVALDVNNEHKRVVLLDLLHRRLCVQRPASKSSTQISTDHRLNHHFGYVRTTRSFGTRPSGVCAGSTCAGTWVHA